jgi:hypothetical protein
MAKAKSTKGQTAIYKKYKYDLLQIFLIKKKEQQKTKQKHNVRTIPKYYKWRQNRYPEHAYR